MNRPAPQMPRSAASVPAFAVPARPGRRPRGRMLRGFTIVELLVAISITLVLMAVVSEVLNQVREAVAVGTADLEVANYATALETRLRDDIRRLSQDGFLVIKNQTLWSDLSDENTVQYQWTPVAAAPLAREVFDGDQLLFFANGPWVSQRFGVKALYSTPLVVVPIPNTLQPAQGLQRRFQAPVARVWYGHMLQGDGATFLPTVTATGGRPTVRPNTWRLGRHTLLISPQYAVYDISGTTHTIGAASPWQSTRERLVDPSVIPLPYEYPQFATAPTQLRFRPLREGDNDIVVGMTMADVRRIVESNTYWLAPYSGNAGLIDSTPAPTPPPSEFVAEDLGWVSEQNPYATILSVGNPSPLTSGFPFAGGGATNTNINQGSFRIKPWGTATLPPSPTAAQTDLAERAKRDRMEAACFRIYGKPNVDLTKFTTQAETDRELLRSQSVLSPQCSQFKVEFAGDFWNASANAPGGDGFVDTVHSGGGPNGAPGGDIYWYGGLNPATNVRRNTGNPYIDIHSGGGSLHPPGATPIGSGYPYGNYTAVFGYDRTVTPWPRMIRVTVTLQDQRGKLFDSYLGSKGQMPEGRTFVFVLSVPQQ